MLAPRPCVPVLDQAVVSGDLAISTVPVRQPWGLSFSGRFGGRRFECVAPVSWSLSAGDHLSAECLLQPLPMPSDWVAGRLRVLGGVRTVQGPLLFRWAQGWRDGFQAFVSSCAGVDDAQWLDFIWFKSSGLSFLDREEVSRSASVSYLAASGIHTVLLGSLVVGLCCLVRLPRPVQLGLAALVLTLFYVAGGSQLSVLRAGLGFVLYSSAYLFKREPDTLSGLALADVLYLVWDPPAVYSLGFQLVTAVVVGFALFPIPVFRREVKVSWAEIGWRFVYGPLMILLLGWPVLLYHLGSASLLGSLFGVLLFLPLPFMMLGSLASFSLWHLVPALSRGVMMVVVLPALHVTQRYVSFLAGLPSLSYFPSFNAYWLVGYYLLLLCVWRPRVQVA